EKFNYISATSTPLTDDDVKELGITPGDLSAFEPASVSRANIQSFLGDASISDYAYLAPLTQQMIDTLTKEGRLKACVKFNEVAPFFYGESLSSMMFPFEEKGDWTLSNYGGADGLYIPAKGATIELTPENWIIYNRCIRNYEGHSDARFDEATQQVYIDGKPASTYTFAMDYYWMMGDNRDNSQDSRFWGFVPEDHVVGTPMIVLASFDRDRGLFDGKIRFDRILRSANPDK
ncbi:MAG: signal peptidase I, partial [Muribaculaceae bacterium]|nr:signal peptidase I [Muribaculaceae bacterium]